MEIVCSVCSVTFEACSRAKYCSGKCKKKAWYYKHRDELSFKQRNISWTKLYRDANKNSINSKRRERFQTDLLYQKRVRNYTIQSRQSKPQNENNRLWRLNNPFKAMLKNLRKRGRRLVNEYDLYLIFQRDAGQCQYCHSYERISIDHKIPVSRGGDSSIDNLCLACLSCNSKKGTKTPEEYHQYLNSIC